MIRAYGRWWSRPSEKISWTTAALAASATTAMFVIAGAAMRQLRTHGLERASAERIETTILSLAPAREPERRERHHAEPATGPARVEPQQPSMSAPSSRPERAHMDVPPPPSDTTRVGLDSTAALRARLIGPPPSKIPSSIGVTTTHGGAPLAAAGVTQHSGVISAATRDSTLASQAAEIPARAAAREMTPQEREALRQQMEPGLPKLGRAARLPGDAECVPLMNGGYSCGITIVSSGGSRDRTREMAIAAAAYFQRRRLEDRMLLRRDSVRADSLRRDSLARAARRP